MSLFFLLVSNPGQYFTFSFSVAVLIANIFLHESIIESIIRADALRLLTGLNDFPVVALVVINLIVAVIVLLYRCLHWLFFGPRPPSELDLQIIFDQLAIFFSFKFVLIGLILEPDMLDCFCWSLWLGMLALLKIILLHGKLRIEYFASSDANTQNLHRPFLHLILVAIILAFIVCKWSRFLFEIDLLPLNMLLGFDLLTTLIAWVQVCACYSIYMFDGGILRHILGLADVDELIHNVRLVADIAFLLSTTLHYIHVFSIAGVSLTLVDALLLLNLRSTGSQLIGRISDLTFVFKERKGVDDLFPNIDVKRPQRKSHLVGVVSNSFSTSLHSEIIPLPKPESAGLAISATYSCKAVDDTQADDTTKPHDSTVQSLSSNPQNADASCAQEDDVCPICLVDFESPAKLLPCGHFLHSECLKQLIRRSVRSTVAPGRPRNPGTVGTPRIGRHGVRIAGTVPNLPGGAAPDNEENGAPAGLNFFGFHVGFGRNDVENIDREENVARARAGGDNGIDGHEHAEEVQARRMLARGHAGAGAGAGAGARGGGGGGGGGTERLLDLMLGLSTEDTTPHFHDRFSVHTFKCPMCRQEIDSTTGKLASLSAKHDFLAMRRRRRRRGRETIATSASATSTAETQSPFASLPSQGLVPGRVSSGGELSAAGGPFATVGSIDGGSVDRRESRGAADHSTVGRSGTGGRWDDHVSGSGVGINPASLMSDRDMAPSSRRQSNQAPYSRDGEPGEEGAELLSDDDNADYSDEDGYRVLGSFEANDWSSSSSDDEDDGNIGPPFPLRRERGLRQRFVGVTSNGSDIAVASTAGSTASFVGGIGVRGGSASASEDSGNSIIGTVSSSSGGVGSSSSSRSSGSIMSRTGGPGGGVATAAATVVEGSEPDTGFFSSLLQLLHGGAEAQAALARQQAEDLHTLVEIFPHLPRPYLERELRSYNNVQVVVERLLAGAAREATGGWT